MCQQLSKLDDLKMLSDYSFDSKMLFAQCYSCRIVGIEGITTESMQKYNPILAPYEIEVFTLFSILYDDPKQTNTLTDKEFRKIITFIRNYWPEQFEALQDKDRLPKNLFMLYALIQFPSQDSFLLKLYRYHFLFTFENDSVNMKERFTAKFGQEYMEYLRFAYVIYSFTSREMQENMGTDFCKAIFQKAFYNADVVRDLSITKEKYADDILSFYKGNLEDCFFGLKLQSLYPIIEDSDNRYIPSPYLTVNAVTESLLNRLTEDDTPLRQLIGKEVLEEYLYSIYSPLPSVTYITKEISYGNGQLSPDVIAAEGNKCIFFDSKEKTPGLKLRKFDDEYLCKETEIYAKNIIQMYDRIQDYLCGKYTLDQDYQKDDIFGVCVVFEDSYLSRSDIYQRAFEILSDRDPAVSEAEKDFIHSRIKILPLKHIEMYALRYKSILPCLEKQAMDTDQWDNYQFGETFIADRFSDDFNDFHAKLFHHVQSLLGE